MGGRISQATRLLMCPNGRILPKLPNFSPFASPGTKFARRLHAGLINMRSGSQILWSVGDREPGEDLGVCMSQANLFNRARVLPGRKSPVLFLAPLDPAPDESLMEVQSFPLAPVVDLDRMRFLTVGQIRSMREERKNYQRLQKNLDAMPVAATIIDENGIIEYVNNGFTQLLGFTAAELLGRKIGSIVSERQLVQVTVSSSSLNARSIIHAQAGTSSGAALPVEISESEMEYCGKQKTIAVFHENSSSSDTAKTHNFLAMVTHELKTPLNCVSGILSLMEDGVLGELTDQGKVMTQQVRQTCRRLVRLVNDLLDLERIQAGKLSLEFESIRLAAICRQAVENLQAISGKRQMQVQVARELRSWGDSDRILQVLINLLSNAIKFSPENSSITISAEALPDEGMVKLQVIDEGRGIPQDKIETVFQCFEQVDILDAKIKGGSGIGLAICKAIVQEHGGEIGVCKDQEKGCSIWFTLPLSKKGENAD